MAQVRRDYIKRYKFNKGRGQTLRNPLFVKKAPSFFGWRTILMVLAGLSVAAGVVWLLCFSTVFAIRTVTVAGTETILPGDIRAIVDARLTQKRLLFLPQRSSVVFDTDALREALNAQFAFEMLNIQVNRTSIGVTVKEKISKVVWFSGEAASYVDLNGMVIRELSNEERLLVDSVLSPGTVDPAAPLANPVPFTMPIIVDRSATAVAPGDQLLPSEQIAAVVEFKEKLKEKDLPVHEFAVDDRRATWAAAQLERGFDLLVDLRGNVQTQVANLLTVMSNTGADFTKVTYIDLRFGDHVYYK